jgi:hypothetical protein
MAICEIKSPVSTTHTSSKLRSNLPLSPGSRSDPSRRDSAQASAHSVPAQPAHGSTSRHSTEPEPKDRSQS